uniref:Uncharacterized protein n=1 Tax=Panagrolaimus davidi TaxID=227884 RepID=A0A914QPI8_9BILA
MKAPSNLIFELTVNSQEEENVETKLSESSKPMPLPLNIPSKVEELNGSGLNVAYFVEGSDTTDHEMTWLSTSQSKSSINSNIIPIKVESKLFLENRIATIPSPTFQRQQTTKKSNLIQNESLKMMQQHRKVESKMQPPSKKNLNFSTKIESKLDEKPEIVGKESKVALSSTPSVPSMPMTFKVPKVNDDENWMNVKINDKIPKKLIPCSTFQRQQTTNLIPNDPLKMMQQPQRDGATIPPPSKSGLNQIELDFEQRVEIANKKSESKYASLLPSKVPTMKNG